MLTAERKTELRALIARCREKLTTEWRDYGLTIYPVYGLPELEQAELGNLAHLLWYGDYGCSRGDVTGFLDLFEQWVNEQ